MKIDASTMAHAGNKPAEGGVRDMAWYTEHSMTLRIHKTLERVRTTLADIRALQAGRRMQAVANPRGDEAFPGHLCDDLATAYDSICGPQAWQSSPLALA